MTNPYETPSDSASNATLVDGGSMLGIEFTSDWSPHGLHQRRKHWRHRVLDISFALLSLLWLGSLFAAAGSPYAGIFCVLTPTWVLLSITWFSNLSFRNGGSFQRKYRGLAGTIRGRIDAGCVVIHGPAVSVATRFRHCLRCKVSRTHAILQLPGFETTLPIIDQDITNSWSTSANPADVTQTALMNAICGDTNAIWSEDTLQGADLRSLPCWRVWRWSGWMLIGLGIVVLSVAVYEANSLPAWVRNPPSHYRFSKTDSLRTGGALIISLMGVGFLGAGYLQLSRTWRRIGRYTVVVYPDRVSIAHKKLVYSYHDAALQHFRWTAVGLIVRDAGRHIRFAIPARWFDEETQQLLHSWYGRSSKPPPLSLYVGPTI
ncbi:MAG: hypothetical protein P8L85_06625 [Rubripirellula sp.]|nr:hypothetical protein [Rubripirellula sp.]